MAGKKDIYSNKFYGTATESAANTLTFAEIQTNVNVFSKEAWTLQRLEWYIPTGTRGLVVDSADLFQCALVSSNKISTLDLSDPTVIDLMELGRTWLTAVGVETFDQPIVRDFSNLPGGGLIIAPRPLFVAVQGTSLATPGTGAVRGYFTKATLSADEYLELVDFYRIVS